MGSLRRTPDIDCRKRMVEGCEVESRGHVSIQVSAGPDLRNKHSRGHDWVGCSRHRPIAHGWRPRAARKTKQASAGSLRETRGAWFGIAHHPEFIEGQDVPEALTGY